MGASLLALAKSMYYMLSQGIPLGLTPEANASFENWFTHQNINT